MNHFILSGIERVISRLPPSISCTGKTGVGCTIGRSSLCRWDREAKQMVDVIPEETIHEQELGIISVWGTKEPTVYISIHTLQ